MTNRVRALNDIKRHQKQWNKSSQNVIKLFLCLDSRFIKLSLQRRSRGFASIPAPQLFTIQAIPGIFLQAVALAKSL
jgi:hypothetical protein